MIYRMSEVLALLRRDGLRQAAVTAYEIRLEEIAKSRTWPYRALAIALGVAYFAILLSCAALLPRRPLDERDRDVLERIAEQFYYVPEIVLFKGIEIIAAAEFDYPGRGLDLGCANGFTGSTLKGRSDIAELHGLDRLPHPLHPQYASFVTGDATRMPYADGTFDFIVSFGVIDHISDLDAVLGEASRVLKPGGTLTFAIQTPRFRESTFWYKAFSFLGLHGKARDFQDYRDVYDMIHHYRSEESWRDTLARAGMTLETIDYIFEDRHLFWYDVMNMQTYFLNVFFADYLRSFLERYPRVRRLVSSASVKVASFLLSGGSATRRNATRYLFRARR